MLSSFDHNVQEAVLKLDAWDIRYCVRMAKRFEHMGIEKGHAESAIKTISEKGIVEKLYQQA